MGRGTANYRFADRVSGGVGGALKALGGAGEHLPIELINRAEYCYYFDDFFHLIQEDPSPANPEDTTYNGLTLTQLNGTAITPALSANDHYGILDFNHAATTGGALHFSGIPIGPTQDDVTDEARTESWIACRVFWQNGASHKTGAAAFFGLAEAPVADTRPLTTTTGDLNVNNALGIYSDHGELTVRAVAVGGGTTVSDSTIYTVAGGSDEVLDIIVRRIGTDAGEVWLRANNDFTYSLVLNVAMGDDPWSGDMFPQMASLGNGVGGKTSVDYFAFSAPRRRRWHDDGTAA